MYRPHVGGGDRCWTSGSASFDKPAQVDRLLPPGVAVRYLVPGPLLALVGSGASQDRGEGALHSARDLVLQRPRQDALQKGGHLAGNRRPEALLDSRVP